MKVTREVILDLLPLYLAGEASPATRALVEEYLAQDAELEQRLRRESEQSFLTGVPAPLPPELELQSIRRTRGLLGLQRWLFGLALGFTAIALTTEFSWSEGHLTEFHLLISRYPVPFGTCALIAAGSWISACLGPGKFLDCPGSNIFLWFILI